MYWVVKYKLDRTPQSGVCFFGSIHVNYSWLCSHDTAVADVLAIVIVADTPVCLLLQSSRLLSLRILSYLLHWGLVTYHCCSVYLGVKLSLGAFPLIHREPTIGIRCLDTVQCALVFVLLVSFQDHFCVLFVQFVINVNIPFWVCLPQSYEVSLIVSCCRFIHHSSFPPSQLLSIPNNHILQWMHRHSYVKG